jgi:hypothetical protein
MSNEIITSQKEIENRIFVIRGVQVMIDRDLAELYQTETRILKQAIKRNLERFPDDFMFELSENEIDYLVSQLVIPSKSYFGGAKPYAFTEQGVAMLSSVLKTPAAVRISLRIIRAFVEMRKFITHNAALFQRLDKVELKQIEADQKFETIFKALESKELPEKGIFFDGQIYDAYTFVANLIRKAEKSLILIDNYIDDTILTLFTKRANNVAVICYTKTVSKQLQLDIAKHNAQYEPITVIELADAHDRFLIIDDKELYHIGASLKELGKKWFAFSKMDAETITLLNRLKKTK